MQVEAKQTPEALVITVMEPRLDAKEAIDFKTKLAEWIKSGHHAIV
jgi:hypothetical protein